ncbi:helix-turn-helix domain-containing protein [Paenactinomyces guangxiensis]|uniref:HTH cro/C1-type domain-containing protein n=1 Tax=Paenactinomyces guangxiensis TaxID=1490290 RepID=A0A7W1WNV8_9BACL|nr:tetratricopeptide repeat protein [Paenactinomyces guangxiensis]MBA4493228.1 hypothetical protein [Paenactinomyces guangxiensis]MBH8589922.1 hypothetical protein [Paenactinomyces guangxiensis]
MDHRNNENLVRYIIRKVRKERGLRQGDLGNISAAVISLLESGKAPLEGETFEYMLKQLDLYPKEKLETAVEKEQEKMRELNLILQCIEAALDKGSHEVALKQLKKIKIEKFHPLAPSVYYLEGRYHYLKNDWNKSSKIFHHALDLVDKNNIAPPVNVLSYCYKDLSNGCFYQNDLQNALMYVNQGIEAFDKNKGRKEVIYRLYANKIQYLMKLSQHDHAAQILNDTWLDRSKIENISVVLNLYQFRAAIFRGREDFEKAIAICNEGIEIAVRYRIKKRHLDLLNILGTVYLKQTIYDKALQCFQIVLWMDEDNEYRRRKIDSLSNIGTLFINQTNWEQADDYLNKALKMGREVGRHLPIGKGTDYPWELFLFSTPT